VLEIDDSLKYNTVGMSNMVTVANYSISGTATKQNKPSTSGTVTYTWFET